MNNFMMNNMSGLNYNKNDDKLVAPKRDAWYTDEEWKEYEVALAALPPPKVVKPAPAAKTWSKIEKKTSDTSTTEYPSLGSNQKKTSKKQQREAVAAKIEVKVIHEVVEVVKPATSVKSKMCRQVMNGRKCTYKTCNFAHTSDELTPYPCSYDNKCRFKTTTCCFIHPGESKSVFVQRLGLPTPNKPEEKKTIEVIRVVGTQDEVFAKLTELRAQGYQHFKVSLK